MTHVRRPRRRWLKRGAWSAACVLLLAAGAHQHVVWSAAAYVYAPGQAPARDAILVLGASVHADGSPSRMLAERLRAAAELYHRGRAPKVLVSGDHGQPEYDEVTVMARELGRLGVPPEDVFLDHSGFRTLDSLYRAREVFGLDNALVVTNPFHVARAVFLGRRLGLDVAGVAADYDVDYTAGTRLRHQAREVAARLLAWLDVFVLHREPEVDQPPVDLSGDGRTTRSATPGGGRD